VSKSEGSEVFEVARSGRRADLLVTEGRCFWKELKAKWSGKEHFRDVAPANFIFSGGPGKSCRESAQRL
jgi:hypothetical protein